MTVDFRGRVFVDEESMPAAGRRSGLSQRMTDAEEPKRKAQRQQSKEQPEHRPGGLPSLRASPRHCQFPIPDPQNDARPAASPQRPSQQAADCAVKRGFWVNRVTLNACRSLPVYPGFCCKTLRASIAELRFELWRFVGRAPLCGSCGTLSTLDARPTQDRPLPEVAGHGREA